VEIDGDSSRAGIVGCDAHKAAADVETGDVVGAETGQLDGLLSMARACAGCLARPLEDQILNHLPTGLGAGGSRQAAAGENCVNTAPGLDRRGQCDA
jgi:hypothetical protein